jgi:hypothetical protein
MLLLRHAQVRQSHPPPPTESLYLLPEVVVLVDFKAIYPGVPPGIFASFPGVAHFLSFEQICQYPRVSRKSTGYPGVFFPRG